MGELGGITGGGRGLSTVGAAGGRGGGVAVGGGGGGRETATFPGGGAGLGGDVGDGLEVDSEEMGAAVTGARGPSGAGAAGAGGWKTGARGGSDERCATGAVAAVGAEGAVPGEEGPTSPEGAPPARSLSEVAAAPGAPAIAWIPGRSAAPATAAARWSSAAGRFAVIEALSFLPSTPTSRESSGRSEAADSRVGWESCGACAVGRGAGLGRVLATAGAAAVAEAMEPTGARPSWLSTSRFKARDGQLGAPPFAANSCDTW